MKPRKSVPQFIMYVYINVYTFKEAITVLTCKEISSKFLHQRQVKKAINVRTRSEISSDSCRIKPNFYCIYTFQIDLAPNATPSGAKSIGKFVI